jgi:hypothetical protein
VAQTINRQVVAKMTDNMKVRDRINASILGAADEIHQHRRRATILLGDVPWTHVEKEGDLAGFLTDVADTDRPGDVGAYIRALLPWANYRASFELRPRDVCAVMGAKTAREVHAVVGELVLEAQRFIAMEMDRDLVCGIGGDESMIGLLHAIGGINYGEISTARHPEWCGNVISNGGQLRALTPDILSYGDEMIFRTKMQPWDHVVTTRKIVQRYAPYFIGGGPNCSELFRMGKRIVRVPHMVAGQLALINTQELQLKTETPAFDPEQMQTFESLGVSRQYVDDIMLGRGGRTASRLMAYASSAVGARTGHVTCTIEVAAALGLRSLRAHALITDIAES